MAIATIRPKTAAASILIDAVDYKTVMSYAEVADNAPLIDETVFSNENQGGATSVGTEVLTISLRGIMKRGAAEATPLIPLPNPAAITVAWDTGCQIAMPVCNFTAATAGRGAGLTGTITGTAVCSGSFTKTWNTAS